MEADGGNEKTPAFSRLGSRRKRISQILATKDTVMISVTENEGVYCAGMVWAEQLRQHGKVLRHNNINNNNHSPVRTTET